MFIEGFVFSCKCLSQWSDTLLKFALSDLDDYLLKQLFAVNSRHLTIAHNRFFKHAHICKASSHPQYIFKKVFCFSYFGQWSTYSCPGSPHCGMVRTGVVVLSFYSKFHTHIKRLFTAPYTYQRVVLLDMRVRCAMKADASLTFDGDHIHWRCQHGISNSSSCLLLAVKDFCKDSWFVYKEQWSPDPCCQALSLLIRFLFGVNDFGNFDRYIFQEHRPFSWRWFGTVWSEILTLVSEVVWVEWIGALEPMLMGSRHPESVILLIR